MKKIILGFAALTILISCSVEESVTISDSTKSIDKVENTDVEEEIVLESDPSVSPMKINEEAIEMDCELVSFEEVNGITYLKAKKMTYEEIENKEEPENPIARILVSDEVFTYQFIKEKYDGCAQSNSFTIAELKELWETNKDMPVRVKTNEKGEIIEMYKDDCSG